MARLLKECSFGFIVAGALFPAVPTEAGEIGVEWGKKDGVVVPAGDPVTQSDAVRIVEEGTFVKAGAGKLVLPLQNVRAVTDASVEVRDGRLEIQPGVPVAGTATAPAFVAAKAAFWVDAAANNGTLVLDGSKVTRWCDRRETDVSSPTLYNARPADASNAGTETVDQTYVNNDGTNAVYFGGCNWQNRRYMQFYKGASSLQSLVNIRHAFVVFGVFDCYNGPLGSGSNPDDWFSAASLREMPNADVHYIGVQYGEASPGAATGRHYLNGERFDPWATSVKTGFQLWETHFLDYTGTAANFFNHKGALGRQGGDYLSEVILFTNDLTSVERLQVQEYLLVKWRLAKETPRDVSVSAESGAVVEIVAATDVTFPTASVTRVVGEGVVEKTGAGELTLDHRSLSLRDFKGELALSAGSLFARRASVPALMLSAGDIVSHAAVAKAGAGVGTIESYEKYGFAVTKTAGRDGVVEKRGSEEICVQSLGADVKRLNVKAGDLTLAGAAAGTMGANAPLFATIPNADFEELFTPNTSYNRYNFGGGTKNHWTGGSGSGVTAYIAENYSPSDTGSSSPHNRGVLCPYPVRQGYNVLSIGNDGYAYTTEASFPKSGYYEMTVLESSRFHTRNNTPESSNALANPGYDILIGDAWATAAVVARRPVANAGNFVEVRIPLGYVEAGTKTFGFKGPAWSGGTTLLLDDIKIRYVGANAEAGLVAIPNGGFESITNRTIEASNSRNTVMYPSRVSSNEAFGWSFDNQNAEVPAAAIVSSYCTLGTSADNGSASYSKDLMPYGDFAEGVSGSTHLSLCGTAGRTSVRFTVAAGVYQLRGRVAQWGGRHNGSDFRNETPSVKATVTVGGQVQSLGSVATRDHRLLVFDWPTVFTVAQTGEIELKLEAGAAADAALVDDLVLVDLDAGRSSSKELVTNGSFEVAGGDNGGASFSGWTKFQPTAGFGSDKWPTVVNPQHDAVFYPGNNTPSQFGQVPYDGVAYARIYNDGGVYQTLALDPGLYRLSFATHSRSNDGYDRNPIRAWLGDTSGREIVAIGDTQVSSVADREHVWRFRVPVRGQYRLYLQGTDYWKVQYAIDSKAHCSMIDGVSLVKVADDVGQPAVADDLRVVVDAGARLRLDYDGSVDIGRLSFGGVSVSGTVSAATHPEYVQGRGLLNVTGKGTPGSVLLVR